MKNIHTIDELFAEFGGYTKLAEDLGVVRTAVHNWKANGAVSRNHRLEIYLMAEKRGIKVAPSLLGLEENSDCAA